ncbi:M13 family metallopeptidase [Novilysobacter avium]|uniref:Peptidase n=1 Tax=Novilysobacter avium TaxID=2781023 RepID=A0A7S6UJ55_9GAMM|nr:M13-type metalloendopeptidase [Lysobacter avium]QOW21268.1 peptidase [Lysobacter avium]
MPTPEPYVSQTRSNAFKPRVLLLSLAIATAVSACSKDAAQDADRAATSATDAPAVATLTLDESALPPVNRFQISDLDKSQDACVDFGSYVNGTWLAANPIPGDRTSWGAFEMLSERSIAAQRQLAEQAAADTNATGVEAIVGNFWATGMDEEKINAQGIKPIQSRLDAIAALDDQQKIADYLRTSAAEGENFLFGFGAEADFKASDMNIAYAAQGGLGLPDKTYYVDADKADKLAAYQAHVAKVLELSGTDAAQAAEQAKQVVAFETRLAKASKSSEEMSRDVSLFYNPMSPADADKLTPNFPWTTFFESQGVATPKMFSLAIPAFHEEVSKMLADVPADQWQAYLRFHTVDGASPYLSDAFVQENFNFYSKAMRGQAEMKERAKRVLDTIENETGEALGQLYVKVAFPEESKAQMERLVGNLSDALKVHLEGLDWMSDETKAKAMEKWASFTPKIGFPEKWRDWSGLNTSRDSYIENVMAANEFNYKWNLSKIGKPVDKTEWGMSPQTVNAYYNPLANEIVFPAAILQPPFFDPNATDEMNYGGIGAVIGHEMIHGYDDQGSRFGPTGNMEDWWTPADSKGFQGRTDKLIAQFDGYEAMPGKHVNGKLTLGENIADLGGLAVAYDAMKKATEGKDDPMTDGMTRDQRFFANWATVWRRNFTDDELKVRLATDPHAPANFRAIGAPSNMPQFAAAFECKPGQPMVRAKDQQVVIW